LKDDPLSAIVEARNIPESSNSAESFSTVASWIAEFKREHPQCRPQHVELPKRVIYIDPEILKLD
jgi:hypothetical protein